MELDKGYQVSHVWKLLENITVKKYNKYNFANIYIGYALMSLKLIFIVGIFVKRKKK